VKLSLYTFVKDGLYYDFHVIEMLKHHLPLADEIIVNEGYSSDGTYEEIAAINSEKIKIIRRKWEGGRGLEWVRSFKNEARKQCTGDWCLLLDCDEFIPEWEFASLRGYLETTRETIAPLKLTNFYGNYKVYHAQPAKVTWPDIKMVIHRNFSDIEVVGDGSNVRRSNAEWDWKGEREPFQCHHFGFVRRPSRLREKWRNMRGKLYNNKLPWFRIPAFLFDWFPHHWKDPQFMHDLRTYEGPYVKAVRDNPPEFVRDRFVLYDYLCQKSQAAI
jgi:glycosyltransferase involved in cell wall biosynthesis